jgi:hypothetical protein
MSFSEFKRKYQHHYLKTQAEFKERLGTPEFILDRHPDVFEFIVQNGASMLQERRFHWAKPVREAA